jgi:hypothetical protein
MYRTVDKAECYASSDNGYATGKVGLIEHAFSDG